MRQTVEIWNVNEYIRIIIHDIALRGEMKKKDLNRKFTVYSANEPTIYVTWSEGSNMFFFYSEILFGFDETNYTLWILPA